MAAQHRDASVLPTHRAVLTGVTCAVGAVVAHLLGGGAIPGPGVLAGVIAAVVALTLTLVRHPLRAPTMLALTLLAQAVLHLIYLVTATGPTHSDDVLMAAAHAGAAVVTTVVATLGEQTLWLLADLAGLRRLRLPGPLPRIPLPAGPGPLPVRPVADSRRSVWVGRAQPGRGPPGLRVTPAILPA